MNKKIKKRCVTILLSLAALTGLYGLWCCFLEDDVIWAKTQVNGIQMEGLTRAQAKDAIEDQFQEEYGDASVTVTIGDMEYEAFLYPMLGLDCRQLLDELYSPGHGPWYTRGLDRGRLMASGEKREVTLEPYLAHPEALSSVISYMDIQKVNTVKETTCRITEDALIITKGRSGVKPDIQGLEEVLIQAASDLDFQRVLPCPVIEVFPKELDLEGYLKKIHTEPSNAYLDEKRGYQVVPSKEGRTFDLAEAKRDFSQAEEGTVITIPFEKTMPEITTQDMNGRVYRDVLGSFTTYGGGTENRINNLTLAAKACDNVELMPGEVFSYNDTLGERTPERGYKTAGVFINGQHAEGYGGGICQVSTTMFVACLYADLEIVERSNHSRRVGYVPEGMDAAVSWGNPDFQFRNNTDYPIRISASYEDGAVNIKIYGTSVSSNTVKITTQQLDAQSYKTYRSTYDPQGNLLGTEEVCTSHYRA